MELMLNNRFVVFFRSKSNSKRISIKTIIEYLLVFYFIFITDSLLFATNSNFLFKSINRFSGIILAVILFVSEYVIKHKKIKPIFFALTGLVFSSALLAGRVTNGYSYYTFIANLWIALIISNYISLKRFSKIFCDEMRLIAIFSLFGWIFAKQIIGLGMFPTITNTVGRSYAFLLFTSIPLSTNMQARNMGPFWEPGAYQFYLVVALFFAMFIQKNKKRFFDIVLFLFTALTTISGVVIIPIIILLVAYFLDKKKISNLVLVLVLSLIAYFFYRSGLFDRAIIKLTGESNSIYFRWIGIEGPIIALFRNPLFGSTPEVNEAIKSELALKYMGITYGSNANTFFNFFGYYGLVVGFYMISRAFKMFDDCLSSKVVAILCFFAFLVSSSNENFTGSLFLAVLIFLKQRSFGGFHESSRN